MRISPRPWGLPFHPHCECEQLEVPPGGLAPIEFRDAGGLAEAMPVGGQVELVGALNWLIRSAGLVSWEDLFDEGGDPRGFEDVVRRKGLTVEPARRRRRCRGRGASGRRAGAAGEIEARVRFPEWKTQSRRRGYVYYMFRCVATRLASFGSCRRAGPPP